MNPSPERIRLTGTPIGCAVRVVDIDHLMDPLHDEQLHSYGLAPEHTIRVLQQRPMTVVLCDHTEIALEHAVAHHVWVEAP